MVVSLACELARFACNPLAASHPCSPIHIRVLGCRCLRAKGDVCRSPMHNTLVINIDIGETRVALIEEGVLAELFVEREQDRSPVGNIYLGKVTRVLPGMQAAFVDIGLDRAAFLHVEDIVPEEDLEQLLAGAGENGDDDHEEEAA